MYKRDEAVRFAISGLKPRGESNQIKKIVNLIIDAAVDEATEKIMQEIKNTQQVESAFWECSKCGKLVFRDRVRCSFCDATRTYTCPECQSEMPGHHANYCSLYKSQK